MAKNTADAFKYLQSKVEDTSKGTEILKDGMIKLGRGGKDVADSFEEIVPIQTRTLRLTQAMGKEVHSLTVRQKKVGKEWKTISTNIDKSTRGFRMGILSVMFGLQNLSRGISEITGPAMEAFGIQDIWSAMMIDLMAPAMEDVVDQSMNIFDAVSGIDEGTKKALGTGLIWTQVLAGIGSAGMSAILGISGAMTEFGGYIPGVGVNIEGLAGQFAAAGVEGVAMGAIIKGGVLTAALSFLKWMPVIAIAAITAFEVIRHAWDNFQRAFTAQQLAAQAASVEDWESYADYVRARNIEMFSGILTGLSGFFFDVANIIAQASPFLAKMIIGTFTRPFKIIDEIIMSLGAKPLFEPYLNQIDKMIDQGALSLTRGMAEWQAAAKVGGEAFTFQQLIGAGMDVLKMLKLGYSLNKITANMNALGMSTEDQKARWKSYDDVAKQLIESGKTTVTVQDVLAASNIKVGGAADTARYGVENVDRAFADLKPTADSVTSSLIQQYGSELNLSSATNTTSNSLKDNSIQMATNAIFADGLTNTTNGLVSSTKEYSQIELDGNFVNAMTARVNYTVQLTEKNDAYNASLQRTIELSSRIYGAAPAAAPPVSAPTPPPSKTAAIVAPTTTVISSAVADFASAVSNAVSYVGSVIGKLFGFQAGGIVTRPMPAIVGEVPEAIIPLSKLPTGTIIHSPTIYISSVLGPDNLDIVARELAEKYAFELSRVSMR